MMINKDSHLITYRFPPEGCSRDERLELEERAAIMEFDGGLPRKEAEEAALILRRDAVKRKLRGSREGKA